MGAKPHYKRKGRPRPGDEISHYTYYIKSTLVENETVIKTYQNQAGRFILATNSLDEKKWTQELILQEYKAQQPTERGFRFIKDPLFFASRVFLKSTKRIMALAMIMTLALMVYSLGQPINFGFWILDFGLGENRSLSLTPHQYCLMRLEPGVGSVEGTSPCLWMCR